MGMFLRNGLLVMLLFHLCHAQDVALASPAPEPAPLNLGDVIDAVKAAFKQAVQSSTDGSVREAFEQVVEELTPGKTPAEQSPAAENMADHTTEETAVVQASEEVAVVLSAGEPDVHVSESNEQIDEESVQEQAQEAGLSQDTDEESAGLIQGLTAQEPFQEPPVSVKSVIETVETDLEAAEAVQVPAESVEESALQGPEIVEVRDVQHAEDNNSEKSPVQEFTADTQKGNYAGRGAAEINVGGKEVERGAGEPGEEFVEEEAQVQKPQLSVVEEKTVEGEIEDVEGALDGGDLKVEEPVESEPRTDDRQAVAAEEGIDGGVVVETEEVEWDDKQHEAADVGGVVTEVETGREKIPAGRKAQLQKVFREVEAHPTGKTEPVETQQEPEVNVATKGPIKLQEPVITKSKATGGPKHEANDMNEIIASRDQNDQGEPAIRNTVEKLPPTPILDLGLSDTKEPMKTHDDSTQSKVVGQEAWKIGAIAAAFFLILQTAVTIVYILKCRRKPKSRSVASMKVCGGGNGAIEHDATNTDTTIPIEEQTAVDDLPEYSQVQQEDIAMETIPLDSTEKNSSHDLRTSVI